MFDSQLLRLIEFDDSNNFKIIFNVIEEQEQNDNNIQISKETHITFNTTINKARIISKIINEIYIVDQTIDRYEIKLENIKENNIVQKVVDIMNLLMNSIGQEIKIPEELGFIFFIIQYHLGEDNDGNNNDNNNDNNDENNNNNDNDENNNNNDNGENNNNINDNNNNNYNDNISNNEQSNELGFGDLLFMYKIYK